MARTKKGQKHLPGMETAKDPKLHARAIRYVEARDARMALTEEETATKRELLDYMRSHNIEHYECEGVCVDLQSTHNVKVKITEGEPGAQKSDQQQ